MAIKHGICDFLRRQVDHSDFSKAWRNGLDNYTVWSYDELCLVTVLAGAHKHSFGIPGSIMEAIYNGRAEYDKLRSIEERAEEIFANTALSDQGKKLVRKMMKQGKDISPQQFSRRDAQVLMAHLNEVNIARGGCINYF